MKLFKHAKPHVHYLKQKWRNKHKYLTQNLFDKHLKQVTIGSLGGLMLLASPGAGLTSSAKALIENHSSVNPTTSNNTLLAAELVDKLPTDGSNLNATQEQQVIDLINKDLHLQVAAEIDNKRLNRTYGVIGGEQHLYRYPGDTLQAHTNSAEDWVMYNGAGIAPGLGAWGYFAPSKAQFTKEDEQRERYYVAVQTFLSPGYSERVAEYRDFYKYRKMLVVNAKTGQAVVADIADAGPGQSTGKHLGGSPEVMHILGLATGPRKGDVLYFFIEDPNDQIPLGPVKVSE